MGWDQIGIIAGGVALLAVFNWSKLKSALGGLGGLVPAIGQTDKTIARAEAWQELMGLCEGECPEAVKLLDELWAHLRPGHTHEVAK